ncbi:putative 5'-3' exonuclease XRNC [Leptomonas pyrrhocoris]|uniref:Putative 5'-3' exonuclease XRNC n=1 Tax=Leptomonas pyrrhocoris TaxID=157538 RepID=A0A0M9G7C8_LEPPY|nr:putative 5'-3' exonuclease XRNC [Leptomonas pyrrhocoris]XP_015662486.1 putative 5'-3' exonuclease XRNC [Leptomonas pyrrhocoris]KPA84046.1 putative 5'-3' exonuclease XRNC [Leptomonas pyrrhocoris]KPA84047.1 putative 5'-3' exonuclease XRNC [Leptomonas pyrrhocoris]|eukprot:XP_015662485.1 putative 5'-3' exonuclease XRNC [Leptomonas pyrrhocoris]
MGVPLLLTWLRKRFADCFLPADSAVTDYIRQSTDNLYIDLNSFLYQAATIITATHRAHRFTSVDEVEDVVLRKLFDLLDDLVLNLVQPKALVYIAVDGVSPLGKMSQQRARRRRGARKTPSASSSSASAGSASHHSFHHAPSGNMNDLWDGNCISVGTRFMAKVTEALHFYAVSRTERVNTKRLREEKARGEAVDASTTLLASPSASTSSVDAAAASPFPSINIIVDDVLRPGEGENKIAEFIRRIRANPGYNPNTSHVICSSDTDVTVTSLILHEPRIHVLRYEPPVALGGKPPVKPLPPQQQYQHQSPPQRALSRSSYPQRGGGGGGPSPHGQRRFDSLSYPSRGGGPAHHRPPLAQASSAAPPKDGWLSTFFSIHVFRQRLREILLLASEADASALAEEEAALVFEHTLHDVVFVLLLFGNDFLPTIGGSIQEGTLDVLLSLLATDFVPRGRTLVDPNTNHIQYASARYLLSCLAELPQNKKAAGGGRLHVHNGSGGGGADAMDWGFTDGKETKERDAAFVERQQRREKQQERMCYCYWTMLQWALQYSAGIVEHWGCYYPYGRAPPLSKLATYCGVLPFDALGEIARRRLEVGARTAGRGDAAAPAGLDDDEEEEDDGMDGLPTSALAVNNNSSSSATAVDAAARGKPTDVMVQLLILIPPRSAALLPTVFRHHYREVEGAVQAPVEQLNLVSIGAWCEEKKRSLSEEERTRFTAYQFFASDANLGSDETPFSANEIAFSAYWSPAEVAAELEAQRSDRKKAANGIGSAAAMSAGGASATAPSGLQSKAASFFSLGRRPVLGALGTSPASSSSAGGSGAAALLANVNLTAVPASPPPPSAPPTPALTDLEAGEASAEVGTPLSVPSTKNKLAALHPTQLLHPKGHYVLWVTPCEALQDPLLVRALGVIQGIRFFAGSYVPVVDQDAVLSRSSGAGQEVRLQFRLAVVPLITDLTYSARLLPGYVEPDEVGMHEKVLAARKVEADRTDPWKQIDKLQTARDARKRVRGDGEEEGEGDERESTEEAVAEAEVAVHTTRPEETASAGAIGGATTAESEAADLQRRKEEARRRLAALKAARLAAQEND